MLQMQQRVEEGAGASQARGPKHVLVSHRGCSPGDDSCDLHKGRRFAAQLEALRQDASKVPFSDRLLFSGLPAELMEDPKWERYVQPGVQGAGWWFWKPAIVNVLLRNGTLSDGDLVVYFDGDVHPTQRAPLRVWERLFDGHFDHDFFVQYMQFPEQDWTKGDIFKFFGTDYDSEQYGKQCQGDASFWVMKVNSRTRLLLHYWEELEREWQLVSDDLSVEPNAPGFRANRNDQSLLSMLLKASMWRNLKEPCKEGEGFEQALHEKYGIEGLGAVTGNLEDAVA